MTHFKAMMVMLVAGALAAWLAREAMRPWLDDARYRTLWLAMLGSTAAVFMLGHAGLLMGAMLVVALITPSALGLGVAGVVGLFLALSITMPPVALSMAGLGGINQLLELSVPRLLAIVLLLPLAYRLWSAPQPVGVKPMDWRTIDALVVGYEVLSIALQADTISGTHMLRLTLLATLDTLLPYYVITRGIVGWEQLRAVLAIFVTAIALVCAATFVEQLLRWPMYSGLQDSYGQRWLSSWVLMRGSLLRVRAMSPQPILLGYVLLFGLGFWLALAGTRWREWRSLMVTGALLLAVYFTVSRGPMMGVAVLLLSLLAMLRIKPGAYGWLLAVLAIGFSVVVLMGWDRALVDGLKEFWGEPTQDTSIDYRKELLDAALALVREHPFLGVPNYLAYMEHLRQGEGIIDVVNTYVYVALAHGIVGVALFLLPFVLVLRRLLQRLALVEGEDAMMARGLVSLIVAALFVLFTTSSWWVMPLLNTSLIALCLAYTRLPVSQIQVPVGPADAIRPWQPTQVMLRPPPTRR